MSQCSRCGTPFQCGMSDGPRDQPCWCASLPPLPAIVPGVGRQAPTCLCPACLRAELARQLPA